MLLTDSHLHLSDGIGSEVYGDFDSLESYVTCVARVQEWGFSTDDPRATMSYGVHPWYCEEWNEETAKRLEIILESDPKAQVGEIGLDSKRGTVESQVPSFEAQLSLASRMDRVASVHDIGCEEKVLKSVRELGKSCRGIILHSYSSDSYVKPFVGEGCMLSINPRILARSEVRLNRLLKAIPLENLLLETDSPHVPKGFSGMEDFVTTISGYVGIEPEELARTVAGNLRRTLNG